MPQLLNVTNDLDEPYEVNLALWRFVGDVNRHGLHGYLTGQQ